MKQEQMELFNGKSINVEYLVRPSREAGYASIFINNHNLPLKRLNALIKNGKINALFDIIISAYEDIFYNKFYSIKVYETEDENTYEIIFYSKIDDDSYSLTLNTFKDYPWVYLDKPQDEEVFDKKYNKPFYTVYDIMNAILFKDKYLSKMI